MQHSIFAAFGAVAVAGTLTLSAQTPTPSAPRPQTPSPSTATRTDDKTMSLTGCLKAQDASMDAGRPAGATSGTAAGGKFVLTNIQGDSKDATKPSSPAPGATSPGATSNAGKQYLLTADAGVNLAAHLNHQVRVTGKLSAMDDHSRGTMSPADPAKPSDPMKPGSTARPGETPHTGDRMGADKSWSTLAVSSVTMISNSCTGATQ